MPHYMQPGVEMSFQGNVAIGRVGGDWTRDLPLDVRRDATRGLSAIEPQDGLVLDLRDVGFVDSWGEEKIADFMQRMRDDGHEIVWVKDVTREADFEGLSRALERRRLEVPSFGDVDAATAHLGARQ